ncbi:hypothetical protein MRX96_006485 [Rhipicephalus microplus]
MESASSDWVECVEVNGRLVNFKLDTGSDVNILPAQLVQNWNPQPTVKATNAKVTTYLDTQMVPPQPFPKKTRSGRPVRIPSRFLL